MPLAGTLMGLRRKSSTKTINLSKDLIGTSLSIRGIITHIYNHNNNRKRPSYVAELLRLEPTHAPLRRPRQSREQQLIGPSRLRKRPHGVGKALQIEIAYQLWIYISCGYILVIIPLMDNT